MDTPPESWETGACRELATIHLGIASSLFRALHVKHPPTARHSLRVSLGCSAFAAALGLPERERVQIEVAALMHDLGKIGVPDRLLNKPSRLDQDERQIMRRHRWHGVQILEACCHERELLRIVEYASTWFDGTQPAHAPICNEALPLGSRVVAIVDAYDAMTSNLVYRRAWPSQKALEELMHSPTQFDPRLVKEFTHVLTADGSPLHARAVRRWVSRLFTSGDELWSFTAPLVARGHGISLFFPRRLLDAMLDGVVCVDLAGRVLVWNRGAERLTGLLKGVVLGRSWLPEVVGLRDTRGRPVTGRSCPVRECLQTRSQAMHRMTIAQGRLRRVAVNLHVVPVLDDDGKCLGATMLWHDVSSEASLERRVRNLREQATQDSLTGVANRAEFDRHLEGLVKQHLASTVPCSLILCDIDHFKTVNDQLGHQAGDAVLASFAALLRQHCRNDDVVARYGGEEFALLCPGCDCQAALRKAESIRRAVARLEPPALAGRAMTVSFGVTELEAGDSASRFLRRADLALYQAKGSGRNRVVHLGSGSTTREPRRKLTWWSWSRPASRDCLRRRWVRCRQPAEAFRRAIRDFTTGQSGQVLADGPTHLVARFEEPNGDALRRRADQSVGLVLEVRLIPTRLLDAAADTPDVGTEQAPIVRPNEPGQVWQILVRPARHADRRSTLASRADQLLGGLLNAVGHLDATASTADPSE
jgi:diguanylate cyclase (GGDEF)-like protein/PAS domain S-box-containing protein